MKKKLFFFSTNRADFGLQLHLLKKFSDSNKFDITLVVTGSHLSLKFGNTFSDIKKLAPKKIKIIKIKIENLDQGYFNEKFNYFQKKFNVLFLKYKIDLVFLTGDRFEILPVALNCLFKNIPLIHLHGGELTYGAVDDSIRYAISKIARLHFVTTQQYKKRLLQIGENPKNVIVSGSPILEHVKKYAKYNFNDLKKNMAYFKKPFVLCTYHPESSNYKSNLVNLKLLVKCLRKLKNHNVLFTYPNFDDGNQELIKYLRQIEKDKNFYLSKSLGVEKYFSFLKHCDLVIGNSSSGIIEAASFKKPVVNLGCRQQGREKGENILNCSFIEEKIDYSLKRALSDKFIKKVKKVKNIYYKKNASKIIVDTCRRFKLNENFKKFYDLKFQKNTKFKIRNQ